jgi:hypothetical protein
VSFDAFSALRRVVKHDRNLPGFNTNKKKAAPSLMALPFLGNLNQFPD